LTVSSVENLLDPITLPVFALRQAASGCAYISIMTVPTSSIRDKPTPAAASLAPLLAVFLLVELVELLPAA